MNLKRSLIIFILTMCSSAFCSLKKQVFACEGSLLSLSCERGTVINIIRANFGRFSNSVCPSSNMYTNTQCIQPTSLRVLNTLCGGKSTCSVPVSTGQFGDPCPDTPKYLQLLYACQPEIMVTTESQMTPL